MFEGAISVRIEIVERDEGLRSELGRALARLGFEVDARPQVYAPAESDVQGCYALHILDLSAPGVSPWLADPELAKRCLFLACESEPPHALASRPERRIDVLFKPFSIQQLEERVMHRIERLRGPDRLRSDPLLQTRDPRLARVFERALEIARRACPISLEGEIGTGRRALARAIHAASARSRGRLVVLESTDIIESAGSAIEEVLLGRVTSAVEGTLLVVEPELLCERAQRALQRALRERAEEEGPRCISISQVPLDESARAGRLSVELLYRLSGATFRLPPLRERSADRRAICTAVARRVARELGLESPILEDDLVARLAREGFPGNRLGLESRLRSELLGAEASGFLASRPLEPVRSAPAAQSRPVTPFAETLDLKTLERETIIRALGHAEGNRTHASAALGISVRTLRNKIREYGLR